MAQKKEHRSILGIDPGTRITGYGLIRLDEKGRYIPIDYGCIRPPGSKEIAQRYRIIFESVAELLEEYQPVAVAVESQFVQKNPQSTLKLGMAKGMVVLAAALREIPVFEYAPSRAKRAVVGNGRASKQQVQAMIKHLLSLAELPEPEDAADALALAICHGQSIISCMNISVEN